MAKEWNLGQAFQEIASRNANRPALIFPDSQVSFAELNARANRLARWMTSKGVRQQDVVALIQNKTPVSYAAMIAALKLGAAYVNLDETNPPARLAHILSTASPRLMLTDHPLGGGTPNSWLDISSRKVQEELATFSSDNLLETRQVNGTAPAYLMFTSGSTGLPKGAAIAHHSVLNFRDWVAAYFAVTENDIFSGINPVFFDNSVFDFYGSLFNGAALAPVPRERLKQPKELLAQVTATGCSIWFSVPSMLIYLSTLKLLSPQYLPTLKTIIFGGEGYPKPELRKLAGQFGKTARLVNVYGPTECTCICSAHEIGPADLEGNGLPPLGRLNPNFAYTFLNASGQPDPAGTQGELCLLGPNLALGYYNDSARTEIAFPLNPTQTAYPERMYRTGDLVRIDPRTGLFHFIGRTDHQIKHMGYRIELEEIEAALADISGISQCAVIYQRSRDDFGHIKAFVASGDMALNEQEILSELKTRLPDYMLPRRVVVVRALPKNANGKIDRQALLHW